jgi:hypothetical protein
MKKITPRKAQEGFEYLGRKDISYEECRIVSRPNPNKEYINYTHPGKNYEKITDLLGMIREIAPEKATHYISEDRWHESHSDEACGLAKRHGNILVTYLRDLKGGKK